MNKRYARTIIWLCLIGFSLIAFSLGLYKSTTIFEIGAGAWYSGWGFLTHWVLTEKMK